MAMIADDRPLFENEEWIVAEDGLEHKQTGYVIERGDIAQRRDDKLWTWPMHMAEKSWCTMTPFAEAFSCAASLYGIKIDTGLAESFKVARCEIAPWSVSGNADQNQGREAMRTGPSLTSDILQNKSGNTISVKAKWVDIYVSIRPRAAPVPMEAWRLRSTARGHASLKSRGGRAPHGLRVAGNRFVQLLQAAWNGK